MDVLLIAVLVQITAGLAALVCSKSPGWATALGAGGATVGCLLGLAPTLSILHSGTTESAQFPWDAAHGAFRVEMDALSAFFLVPILGLGGLTAIFGGDYLFAYRHEKALGGPWFFFNLFIAGMVLVVIARTVVLFVMAWEAMSLAAYFLVTFEHEKTETRHAGWVFLIATHLGAAFLILALVIVGWHAGSLQFNAFNNLPGIGGGWRTAAFVLALIGFGTKAGFVPFHVWLPEAHSAAPSHVSALMSGVMIKMGLYGLLRVLTFLGPPAAWWGPTLAVLGLVTALAAITLALQQRDIKRVLAYSSIENMGLIGFALGLGLIGHSQGDAAIAVLGFSAALLHAWNHSAMKGLVFLTAGSVLHATGTRDMERLGGLMKRMPWTGGAMLVGAIALAALPPLNGFVSKWLMYLTLLREGFATTGGVSMTAMLAVGLLAMIGGLSAITFVRLTGIVLFGSPRSDEAEKAQEGGAWLVGPLVVLVAVSVIAAAAPSLIAGPVLGVVDLAFGWKAGRALHEMEITETPLGIVGALNVWTAAILVLGVIGFVWWLRNQPLAEGPTWGCGYAQLTAKMQYTGRSFVEMLAEHLLPRFLRPNTSRRPPQGLFPEKSEFASETPDPVHDEVYVPFFRRWAERFAWLRILQQGKLHIYLIYIVVIVVLALGWISARRWLGVWEAP